MLFWFFKCGFSPKFYINRFPSLYLYISPIPWEYAYNIEENRKGVLSINLLYNFLIVKF